MKVVLAEKPSVARDIAACQGCHSRKDGYFEGSGYQVTWAFGHLFTLKEPGAYDPIYRKWSLDTLPIVPERFELELTQGKGVGKQFATIKRLFRAADEIICATDAGREGELIFRRILHMAGCAQKPTRRLWLSSLTQDAIRTAFRRLRPLSDYDDLYAAARSRSEADWIVGLNATRSFTLRYGQENGVLWSVGRVQTPVLGMIVERDDTIRSFTPEPFWEVMTRYRAVLFRCVGGRLPDEENATAIVRRVQGHPLSITGVETRNQRQAPPLLYDLTELQRGLNRRHGMSAAAVLKVAQSLYEAKLITYPRTDSRYLSEDMKSSVRNTLDRLGEVKREEISRLDLESLVYTRRIVNDGKVTDHHAIIPTGKLPGALEATAQKVFDAVLTRLIAAFYPPCVKAVTTVDAVCNGVIFQAKGVRVLDPGWTILYPTSGNGDKHPNEQELPRFTVGESGPHEPLLRKGETQPPRHFTEDSLLGAMETAGKLVDEEDMKEALKEKGLGTPATRSEIIETLLRRDYATRSRRTLTATDLGRYLIALVHDPSLKSPELTGEWEGRLREMEDGTCDPAEFHAHVVNYTRRIIDTAVDADIDRERLGPCPCCGKPVIEGNRGYGCSGWRDGCSFVLWRDYQGLALSDDQVRTLLQRRILMQHVVLPEGRPAVLYLSQAGVVMDVAVPDGSRQRTKGRPRTSAAGSRKGGKGRPSASTKTRSAGEAPVGDCPLCGGAVVERSKSFSCAQPGCELVVWKMMARKRIGVRTVRTLLTKGQTSVLKGFLSKKGTPFQARLVLKGAKVEMEFPR